MRNKPQMKRPISITSQNAQDRVIYFDSSAGTAQEMAEFGELTAWGSNSHWQLRVDARFDFVEVAAYIQEYQPLDVPDAFKDE